MRPRWLVAVCLALLLVPVLVEAQGTTEDPGQIVIEQAHIFVTPLQEGLEITEYYLLSNRGTETYVGERTRSETGPSITVVFPLPVGADELRFVEEGEPGERYRIHEEGVADTRPIPPGQATVEVGFDYTLPYEVGEVVVREFPLRTEAVVLVVPGERLALAGSQIAYRGPLEMEDTTVGTYAAGPLEAGESLSFSVVLATGEAEEVPVAPAVGRHRTREVGLGLVALAGAIAAAYSLWAGEQAPPAPEEVRPLVEAIAALDARFEAGEVEEEAYRRERARLKAEALQALASVRGAEGA
jgi:hypothetical protein